MGLSYARTSQFIKIPQKQYRIVVKPAINDKNNRIGLPVPSHYSLDHPEAKPTPSFLIVPYSGRDVPEISSRFVLPVGGTFTLDAMLDDPRMGLNLVEGNTLIGVQHEELIVTQLANVFGGH